ncbi:MAG: chorismate synthase [Varibaculum sp.]|nr:chorismate synthase [Varibaculum sp.]
MLRWLTAGESHGKALTGILDGLPSGVAIQTEDIRAALARRRLGYGRGARQKFERDEVEIVGGVLRGYTIGSPVAIIVHNSEWPKWETVMSSDPVTAEDLLIDAGRGDERESARNKPLTRPRPGHADLPGVLAYDLPEIRPVLERASARETAMRVALGTVAAAFIEQAAGIRLVSHVTGVGSVSVANDSSRPVPEDREYLDDDPMHCFDPEVSARMVTEIDAAKYCGDTLGGTVEVIAYGVPVGLGTHTQADRRLDARLAEVLMGIQAVKGVEVGLGFAGAKMRGSQLHDRIYLGGRRQTNNAGGIEGGMSNGEPIVVRAAVKPIATVPHALPTIDLVTGEESSAIHQRSDTTAVAPAAVIAEAMVALGLAGALLEHFGGYSLKQVRDSVENYNARVLERLAAQEGER